MQVRLTVEDGGVAGPGGHDEDVDEFDEDVDVVVDVNVDVDVEVDGDVAGPDGHDVTSPVSSSQNVSTFKHFPKHIKGDHPKYAKMASCCERYW